MFFLEDNLILYIYLKNLEAFDCWNFLSAVISVTAVWVVHLPFFGIILLGIILMTEPFSTFRSHHGIQTLCGTMVFWDNPDLQERMSKALLRAQTPRLMVRT